MERVRQQEDALRTAELRAEVIRLRRAGKMYDEVTAMTGVPRGTAHRWVKEALKAAAAELGEISEVYRAESMDRLTVLLGACWDRAVKGSDKHISEARRIISDMNDLMGAKAPVQVEIGESDVDRLLRDALEEFGRRTGADDRQAATAAGDQAPA